MAVIQRITDFIPNTLIVSQEVDDEFNQLVNLLSGVSDDNDTILKYSHATDPVLRIDQLGAGEILRLLQNGAVKTVFDNSGHLYIGEGVTDATPANGVINGTGGSGTNIGGADLDLAGGKGTGTAEAGFVAVRYPLKVASGTTLQALSTGRFPVVASMYSITSLATAVANTTTETSLLTGASVAAESTRTVEAGMTAAGAIYRVRIEGAYQTTGTPTIQFRIKFGTTTVSDSTAFATPNNSNGSFVIDTLLFVYSVGGAGSVRAEMIGALSPTLSGAVTLTNFRGNNLTGVDFTASQTLEVTVQWGTASASNSIQTVGASIERLR